MWYRLSVIAEVPFWYGTHTETETDLLSTISETFNLISTTSATSSKQILQLYGTYNIYDLILGWIMLHLTCSCLHRYLSRTQLHTTWLQLCLQNMPSKQRGQSQTREILHHLKTDKILRDHITFLYQLTLFVASSKENALAIAKRMPQIFSGHIKLSWGIIFPLLWLNESRIFPIQRNLQD